ncbi:helix-turn-helix transcriptional regulator [Streptomyces sp. NPDC003717]|uniref:helix-turn-helix domain-containing protein n=1 Tax=Streptomyces sp. NPDC003717 TaxID=3154276 RepID=UPI0033A58EDD
MSTRDEVEEFAALLRLLKDRTDRSYGSLARRVSMNTSTLHRYCAGEAVPQDFAPVERLAAFCAATPEERLELHRLWLAALAARRRVRTAAVPADTARTATPAPAQAPAPAPAPAPDPDPDEPGPAPRPWYHRRRALASAAVACALLATLGLASALADDHPSAPEAASPTAPPRRTAPSDTPRPTASPSPSSSQAPTSSPTPRSQKAPAATTTSTPTPTAGRPPSATDPKPATGTPPLTWSADSQVWNMGCGHDYVIGKPPAQVPPPPVQQDAAAWAATQGAVHGHQTMVRISVQGRSATAVVLEALRVRVVSRGAPAGGTAYAMDQGCGGELTPRRFTVNLDADRPVTRPADGADSEHTLPAVHFPYRVSAEDPEALLVDATTLAHDARWYLELDWSSQGRTGTLRIDDHGRPFHTTSIAGLPHYWYGTNGAGERAWVPYGD